MRYYLDTEFYETPGSIELISLGMVSEDGRELYFETPESRKLCQQTDWLFNNVLPHLKAKYDVDRPNKDEQKKIILEFIGDDKSPEFYGYYADYDWVVFCWIFGRMIDLPEHFPMYCIDLKQILDASGMEVPDGLEPQNAHDVLADAYYHKRIHNWIESLPGKYNGVNPLHKLHDGEPYFFLRAQDVHSPYAVRHYAQAVGVLDVKARDECLAFADHIEQWQEANHDKVKLPD